jgi:deaminated glutathione amidase
MTLAAPYTALALQTTCHAINRAPDTATARAWMREAITRVDKQIRTSKQFIGPDVRLVVLPEYFASSYPTGEAFALWAERAAWAPDGPEYAAMSEVAVKHGVFLSGNVYETDAHFPGLYFQASFIINDAGALILRYRRLVSMFAPTPHDVWDVYLTHYGMDAIFPVADTVLGKLACIASEEILYPEIARVLALKGAEVFLHSTSEAGSPRLTPKDVAKRARAYENMAWVVSANSAGIVNSDFPTQSTDGLSKVVDHRGEVRAEAGFGESMVAHAEVDVQAVRRARAKPGMTNVLARQRLELFAELYRGSVYPANTMLDDNGALTVPERSHFIAMQQQAIAALRARGVAGDAVSREDER